jgi:hypothetical protein
MANVSMTEELSIAVESRPIDERILDSLRTDGTQTLDRLSHAWPAEGWAPVFLAIDRLSRVGKIVIGPPKNGDYLVSVAPGNGLGNIAY